MIALSFTPRTVRVKRKPLSNVPSQPRSVSSERASSRRAMYSAAASAFGGSLKIAGLSTPAIAACSTTRRS